MQPVKQAKVKKKSFENSLDNDNRLFRISFEQTK